jgi:hypothetical protein
MEPWYDCCGGGSICTGNWTLGLNNQCRSYSYAIKTVLSKRLEWDGKVICLFFRSHVNGQPATVHCRSCGTTCTWVRSLSAHGHWCLWWSARGCLGTSSEGVNIWGTLLAWIGWACIVWRRTVNGLDQWLGPTPRKCGRASYSDVQQGFDLFWNDAPLQSVKGCDMLPLVLGRSYKRCRKGALKALVPCVGCRA